MPVTISERDVIKNFYIKSYAKSNKKYVDKPKVNFPNERKLISEILENVSVDQEKYRETDGEYYYPEIVAVLLESFLLQGSATGQFRSLVKTENYENINYIDRNKFFLDAMDFLIDGVDDPILIEKLNREFKISEKEYFELKDKWLKKAETSLETNKNNLKLLDSSNQKGIDKCEKAIQYYENLLKHPESLDGLEDVKKLKEKKSHVKEQLRKYENRCELKKTRLTAKKGLINKGYEEYSAFHGTIGQQIKKLGDEMAKLVTEILPEVIGLKGLQADNIISELHILLEEPTYERFFEQMTVRDLNTSGSMIYEKNGVEQKKPPRLELLRSDCEFLVKSLEELLKHAQTEWMDNYVLYFKRMRKQELKEGMERAKKNQTMVEAGMGIFKRTTYPIAANEMISSEELYVLALCEFYMVRKASFEGMDEFGGPLMQPNLDHKAIITLFFKGLVATKDNDPKGYLQSLRRIFVQSNKENQILIEKLDKFNCGEGVDDDDQDEDMVFSNAFRIITNNKYFCKITDDDEIKNYFMYIISEKIEGNINPDYIREY